MISATGVRQSFHSSWMPLWVVFVSLLLWPAAVNGGAFLFPDMPTYLRGFDASIYRLTGVSSDWTQELLTRYPRAAGLAVDQASNGGPLVTAAVPPDKVVLSGRSVYYGALLYLSDLAGSFWFLILLQSALVATSALLALRRLQEGAVASRSRWLLLLIPLVTPVGFFAGLMMPDILAALVVLGLAMMHLFWGKMRAAERVFWVGLLALAMLSHSANLLIAGSLVLLLAIAKTMQISRGVLVPLVLPILIGFAGEAAFSWGVKSATGFSPVRPPFLTARLTADGPGTDYLRQHCGKDEQFVLCRYRHMLPVPSDTFLWSAEADGVFMRVPPATQRQLAEEQTQFALTVIADRPFQVLGSSLLRMGDQLSRFSLSEFAVPTVFPERLSGREARIFLSTRAAQSRMPVWPVELVTLPLTILSLIAAAFILRREPSSDRRSRRLIFLGVVLGGLLINAAVCGALSTPHDRYQMRMLWLLPFAALALAITHRPAARSELETVETP